MDLNKQQSQYRAEKINVETTLVTTQSAAAVAFRKMRMNSELIKANVMSLGFYSFATEVNEILGLVLMSSIIAKQSIYISSIAKQSIYIILLKILGIAHALFSSTHCRRPDVFSNEVGIKYTLMESSANALLPGTVKSKPVHVAL